MKNKITLLFLHHRILSHVLLHLVASFGIGVAVEELLEEGEGLDLDLGLVALLDGEDLLDDLALGVGLRPQVGELDVTFYF